MPRTANKNMPIVVSGVVYTDDNDTGTRVDSEQWREYLTRSTRFSFQGKNGYFTVRSEQRRNGQFWYAFKTVDGKTRKIYLGKAESLTLARLNEVAEKISILS